MKLFGQYLRERIRGILFFFICAAIFLAVFFLYHLPLKAAFYPALLSGTIGSVLMLLDFWRYRKKRRELAELLAHQGELPPAATALEEDYQALIQALRREKTELCNREEAKYRDTVEYFTTWAHQIKTPISSMALTLQEEDTQEARRLRLDLFHIEQYVEMVLAYLRLDAPSGDYVFRSCRLDDVIRGTVKKLAPEFIARHLSLTYEPIERELVTDEKWLAFVLEQILTNALKYTHKGGIAIELESPEVLAIRDTGIGISPADLPRIFEKGYTGCNGRIDRRASGLGLYLCQRVCQRLEIGISAESRPDEGTTIRLDLHQYRLRAE